MYELVGVGEVQRGRGLMDDSRRTQEAQAPHALDQRGQVDPVHPLAHDVDGPVCLADLM